jgi:hypothetical protein
LTVIRRTKAPAQGGGIRTPGDTRLLASCAVFKVRGGASAPHELPDDWSTPATEPVSQNSTACGRRRRPLPNSGDTARRATSAGPIDISVAGSRRPRPKTTGIGGVPGSRYASAGAVQPLQILELP